MSVVIAIPVYVDALAGAAHELVAHVRESPADGARSHEHEHRNGHVEHAVDHEEYVSDVQSETISIC